MLWAGCSCSGLVIELVIFLVGAVLFIKKQLSSQAETVFDHFEFRDCVPSERELAALPFSFKQQDVG